MIALYDPLTLECALLAFLTAYYHESYPNQQRKSGHYRPHLQ